MTLHEIRFTGFSILLTHEDSDDQDLLIDCDGAEP